MDYLKKPMTEEEAVTKVVDGRLKARIAMTICDIAGGYYSWEQFCNGVAEDVIVDGAGITVDPETVVMMPVGVDGDKVIIEIDFDAEMLMDDMFETCVYCGRVETSEVAHETEHWTGIYNTGEKETYGPWCPKCTAEHLTIGKGKAVPRIKDGAEHIPPGQK